MIEKLAEMRKKDMADSILGQKSGPMLTRPAGLSMTALTFCSQIICWLCIMAEIHNMLIRVAENTLIRLFLQNQSDLGQHCLPWLFWPAT